MPGHRPEAIANEFLEKSDLTQMQLQKLVYIAHGWTLALTDEALVSEEPRAWDYGPVFPGLREHVKYAGKEPLRSRIHKNDNNPFAFFENKDRGEPYKAVLTADERLILDTVWDRYGHLSAFDLSNLTHRNGTPWSIVYRSPAGRSSPISNRLIKEHYLEIAKQAKSKNAA